MMAMAVRKKTSQLGEQEMQLCPCVSRHSLLRDFGKYQEPWFSGRVEGVLEALGAGGPLLSLKQSPMAKRR
jgi:hypothetical protein